MRPNNLEISKASFSDYVKALKNYAKQHPDKKILLITLVADHGFQKDGFQTLVANRYDQASKYYEQIEVEKNTLNASERCPNIYTLNLYAACRVINRESDFKFIRNLDKPNSDQFMSKGPQEKQPLRLVN